MVLGTHMEITFVNGLTLVDSKHPYFLGDRGIDGYVSLSDSTDAGFDAVKISLEGVLVTTLRCIDWYTNTLVVKTQKLLELNTIKKPGDFLGIEEPTKRPPTCFFHFDIPQSLHSKLLGQNCEFLGDLPASMPSFEPGKRHPVLQPRCAGECNVVYAVRAQAFRQDDLLASCTSCIKIIPSLDIRPPICVADFPGEYALARSSHRGLWFQGMTRTQGLRVEASTPEPVVLAYPTDCISILTCLTLTQTASPTRECRQQWPKDVVDCQCSGSLVALTFISNILRQNAPTAKDLLSEPTLSRNTYVCAKAQVTAQFSKWREVTRTLRDESNETSRTITQWQTEAPLKLELRSTSPRYLVPSFESSLVSRRHKLDLQIRMVKPRRCVFHLTLPLQILYRTDGARISEDIAATDCPPYFA